MKLREIQPVINCDSCGTAISEFQTRDSVGVGGAQHADLRDCVKGLVCAMDSMMDTLIGEIHRVEMGTNFKVGG